MDPATRDNQSTITDPAPSGRGQRLIRHIVSHHHAYLRRTLPSLEGQLERLGNEPAVLEARRLLTELSDELMLHMEKEERILFPVVGELEQALETGGPGALRGCGVEGPISQMSHEHQNALAALDHLQQLGSRLPATPGVDLGQSFGELASDLREHIRLEEEELFPLARQLAATV